MFDLDVDTSAPRGRTLDGGTIWSLGIKVPRGASSGEGGAADGPLHPAVHKSLETLIVPQVCSSGVVLVLLSGCLSCAFRLQGWYFAWEFSPSRLDPFSVSCVLSSLSFCWVVRRRRFPLSQALGKSKNLWFGFPLVTLPRGHGLRPRPVHLALHLHQGRLPYLFFSSLCSRRCSDLVGFSLSLSLYFFLCLLFVWCWAVVCFALYMRKYKIEMGRVVRGTTAPMPLSSLLLGEEQLAGNCTVTFVFLLCSPVERGNAVRFCHFRFFFVFGSASFVLLCSFFLLGSLFGMNFRERTFVFSVLLWLVAFEWRFAYVFVLCFGFSLPDMFQKNSLDVRFSFWGRSLFLTFYYVVVLHAPFFLFSER